MIAGSNVAGGGSFRCERLGLRGCRERVMSGTIGGVISISGAGFGWGASRIPEGGRIG